PQILQVAETLGARRELLLLARPGREVGELLQVETQLLGLARTRLAVEREHLELGRESAPLLVGLGVVAQQGRVLRPRGGVEGLPLGGRRTQAQLIRLPVYDDELDRKSVV